MSNSRSGKINESTMIPIGLAVVVIGAAAGWVTKTTYQLSDQGDRLARIEKTAEQVRDDVLEIKSKMKEVSYGSGFPKSPNIEHSTPKGESVDASSIRRSLEGLKTGNASYERTTFDARPEDSVDAG